MNLIKFLTDSILAWYTPWVVTIGAFFVFNIFRRSKNAKNNLAGQLPKDNDYKREVLHATLSTTGALVLTFLAVQWMHEKGLHNIIMIPREYQRLYFFASFPLVILAHDAYFYWTHRMLHTPWFYKKIHHVHHQSKITNPLTALSFHLGEGVILFSFMLLFSLVFPLPYQTAMFFGWFSVFITVMGHSGHSYFPKFLRTGMFGTYLSNPMHHYVHHAKNHCNYGIYFNFWDRVCKTEHPDYQQALAKFDDPVEQKSHLKAS